jgi:SAM-dependent methyltransferase
VRYRTDRTWPRSLSRTLGGRVARLGELLGNEWLTYNPLYFRDVNSRSVADAPAVMRALETHFPDAQRLIDVGAGTGAHSAEAQRRGKTVIACEHSATGRRAAARQGVRCSPFDLERDPPVQLSERFDLAFSFEVAEHLPEPLGLRLVSFLSSCAPLVVFSAAQPGQGGTGHVNEQPKRYWIDRFEAEGMPHRAELSAALSESFRREGVKAPYLVGNVMVFGDPRMASARPAS